MRRGPMQRALAQVGHRVVILGFTAFAIFPFYWMLITAFKQNSDLYVGASNTSHNPFIFNQPPTLAHLKILFQNTLYPTWLFNSLWVGALVVLFLNLFLTDAWYRDALRGVLDAGDEYGGAAGADVGERVLVEFVSANPTGPLTAAGGRHGEASRAGVRYRPAGHGPAGRRRSKPERHPISWCWTSTCRRKTASPSSATSKAAPTSP